MPVAFSFQWQLSKERNKTEYTIHIHMAISCLQHKLQLYNNYIESTTNQPKQITNVNFPVHCYCLL